MKIYVNEQYEILSLDKVPESYFKKIKTENTRGQLFGTWCDTCINGYRYEPAWEYLFNDDGSHVLDEYSNPIYKLDETGERIADGWQCYPFVDCLILSLIQKQYESNQAYVTELQLALTEQFETNLMLLEEVTNTQLALTELYEGKEA